MTNRLRAVAEEAVHTLLGDGESSRERDLLLVARADGRSAGSGVHRRWRGRKPRGTARDAERGRDGPAQRSEMPLRLLRHYATSVRHQQYHDTDIVTFRVEPR